MKTVRSTPYFGIRITSYYGYGIGRWSTVIHVGHLAISLQFALHTMRLYQILVVLSATLLFAGEVSSMSSVSTSVASPTRLLRTHHTTTQDNTDSEERSLTPQKMMSMMKDKMTTGKYATKLGISTQLKTMTTQETEGLTQYMQSTKYIKLQAYSNFLNEMGETKKFADLVKAIKAM